MSILWSHRRRAGTNERGSALVGVLLLLLMMSALAAALGVNGQTETLISRNQRSAAQARAAAEAGLNHAVEVATTYVFQWKANGFNSPTEAIDALLSGPDGSTGTALTDADNTSLGARAGIDAAIAIPLGARLTIAGGINAEYEAFVMDDDADAPDEPTGDPYHDENETLIVRATGYAQDNTTVVLEARLAPLPLPAVATNGDLELGSVTIVGATGGAHSNGDMLVGNAQVIGEVTAAGDYDGPDDGSVSGTGGAAPLSLPDVRASDYRAHADYILNSAGEMTDGAGTLICVATDKKGCDWWDYKPGEWSYNSNAPGSDGTYYVEGDVKMTGSPGSKGNPKELTIIAEGSIDVSGSPDIMPDALDLLFVTDGDLDVTGSITTHGPGQILVHEQIRLSGSPFLDVQITVENATSVDPLVQANSIGGSAVLVYDGGLATGLLSVSGWRDIR